MVLLGAHVSTAGGIWNAVSNGDTIGCTAIQVFSGNARTWKNKVLSEDSVYKFHEALKGSSISKVIAHASYLPNLASADEALFAKSIDNLLNDLVRCRLLGINDLVLHPGSSKKMGYDFGVKRIVKGLDLIFSQLHSEFDDVSNISLETTAGSGNHIGSRFEELAEIIEKSSYPDNITVTLDTCHMFAAGYDLRTESAYFKTMETLRSFIDPSKIKAIHLNDSKTPLGSNKDRHEQIGLGEIGEECFRLIMQDPHFENVPKIIETPKKDDYDRKNLILLRSFVS